MSDIKRYTVGDISCSDCGARQYADRGIKRAPDGEMVYHEDIAPQLKEIAELRAEVSRLGGELKESQTNAAHARTERDMYEHDVDRLKREIDAARTALQPICDAVSLTCAPWCSLTDVIKAIEVSLPVLEFSAPADEESER